MYYFLRIKDVFGVLQLKLNPQFYVLNTYCANYVAIINSLVTLTTICLCIFSYFQTNC